MAIDLSLPLCELHRHLDGSIRLQTMLELAEQHSLKLPADNEKALAPFVHINQQEPGLMAFLARFEVLCEVLADLDACRRIAYENVEDARDEGIDHIELRFSPWFMAERHGLNPAGVVEACIDGAQSAARELDISVGLIGILSRTYGPAVCQQELDALLNSRTGLVAIDLAGDEEGFPASEFKQHFRRVHDAGLAVTVHAGEADGPQSVWSAIRDLGAHRIGHGFRSAEDLQLVAYLAETGIGLECCPTSNLHISAIGSYAEHPILQLAEHGVRFCLNTDDPGISNITLAHEYEVAAPEIGLNEAQVRQSQRDALAMSFLSDASRERLVLKAARRMKA